MCLSFFFLVLFCFLSDQNFSQSIDLFEMIAYSAVHWNQSEQMRLQIADEPIHIGPIKDASRLRRRGNSWLENGGHLE